MEQDAESIERIMSSKQLTKIRTGCGKRTQRLIQRALRTAGVLGICFCLSASPQAWASPLSLSVSLGDLEASAMFDVSGTDLIVKLANTSTADVMTPNHVLTALFFDIDSIDAINLTPVDAVVGAGSVVHFGVTGPAMSVAGEWAYKESLTAAPFGASNGISSSGFGLFGASDRFGSTNLQGPDSPDGLQYGITSAGDDETTGNTPVTGTHALIQSEVVFTLSGLPVGFDPFTQITNVIWQYGTNLSEPTIRQLPEPTSLALLSLGALTLLRRNSAQVMRHRRAA